MLADVVEALEQSWTEELGRAIRERSAFVHLGAIRVVEASMHKATLGGFFDRRVVPVPQGTDVARVLEAWRHTPDGRVIDRMLVYTNMMALQRTPQPLRTASVADVRASLPPPPSGAADAPPDSGRPSRPSTPQLPSSLFEGLHEGSAPIVAFGAATDLLQLVRLLRGSASGARLRPAAVEQAPRVVSLVTADAGALDAEAVPAVSVTAAAREVHVVAILELLVRSRGALRRVDLALRNGENDSKAQGTTGSSPLSCRRVRPTSSCGGNGSTRSGRPDTENWSNSPKPSFEECHEPRTEGTHPLASARRRGQVFPSTWAYLLDCRSVRELGRTVAARSMECGAKHFCARRFRRSDGCRHPDAGR